MEYPNLQQRIAHHLTGSICGQCKCSLYLGWSKPTEYPNCECYAVAGEIVEMVLSDHAAEQI